MPPEATSKPEKAEVTPKPSEPQKEMDIYSPEAAKAALAEMGSKKPEATAQKPVENESKEPKSDAPEPTEPESELSPLEENAVETVTVNGKEVKAMDLYKKAKFTIPAGDEDHELTGEQVLMFAGKGILSAEANRKAKETLAEAQRFHDETEKSIEGRVREGVTAELDRLLDVILDNNDPATGKPFATKAEKGAAEAAVRDLQSAHAAKREPTDPADRPMTKKELEAALAEREQRKETEERSRKNLAKAQEVLEETTKPFMQLFLKADGKTLNERPFQAFKMDVQKEAIAIYKRLGRTVTEAESRQILQKAVKAVYADYKESLGSKTTTVVEDNKPKVPVLKPSGGGAPAAVEVEVPKGMGMLEFFEHEQRRLPKR